ncbi:MAG: 5-(carboxyamino)imidazole ribonucleotide synthase [Planktomarina sp.]|uniref:5-(carboxyamino)imidazole ribonucleotide synthase n=1 Tax=Planktomarina sp. TaxID=2024851 RepID=UPI00289147A7|nr:5-(carboxyamino)imidazole ribonucleotide synthase [Planktomarina sp.]MDG1294387.1 5-(carboxyamino)imidazole ribonucleotide synthase [Planktomarina sp.]MDT2031830.1 5-(carboxyamino)imidazole ribonucleotide synthase [Planktomarina sp.]
MNNPLPQGACIGILGGGQLGRMLTVAASRLGLKAHIFEPGANTPAGQVAQQVTTASYEDEAALRRFAQSVDVITYEFENIPTSALDILEQIRPIHPDRRALAKSQDRLSEKEFLTGLGLKVAPYANVTTDAEAKAAAQSIGTPSILKTRRMGYDGKGQIRLKDASDMTEAWQAMQGAPSVLERFINFTHEVSVIAARARDGQVACYDPGENAHREGILHSTTVPATLSAAQRMDAVLLAGQILNALDYVGVMGVELFVTTDGLIVNEIAPRVHNSGHWTQNGCDICQFEQHIRAVAGWPLGDGSRHSDIRMENLIGAEMDRVPELRKTNAALHLYGKSEIKPGRKMGHVNFRT